VDPVTTLLEQAKYLVAVAFIVGAALVGLTGLAYLFVRWWKFKDREKKSLDFVLLQVAVPRDNETKIDAAEQMFASLFSLKKGGGILKGLKAQDHLSFEIVARKEDIRFYISVPDKLRDLVEKQIHGAYPGAEVQEVDEYNVFTDHGKVAFAALKLKNASRCIKIYQ